MKPNFLNYIFASKTNISHNSIQNFLRYFSLLILFCLLQQKLYAQNYLQQQKIDEKIFYQIENNLLFSTSEQEQIDIFQNQKKEQADLKIMHDESKEETNIVNFAINHQTKKTLNISNKEKEKIAYNSYRAGQYEVAVELFKQIIQSEPENNYARYSLAVIYQKMKQYYNAKLLYYDLLKRRYKDRHQVISNLITIIADESPKKALYLISRLAINEPQSSYLKAKEALIYENLRQYDKAISSLKTAINLEPERVDYYYNLAIIYDKNDQYKKAISTYYQVIKLYKKDKNHQNSVAIEQVYARLNQLKMMI